MSTAENIKSILTEQVAGVQSDLVAYMSGLKDQISMLVRSTTS